jgi:hypothetical protein
MLADNTTDSLLGFYPLQKGNTWIYMATPMGSGPLERFTKRMVIGDTVLNDGHTYSIIDEYWNTSQLRRTAYIRIDTSTLEIIERMDQNVETIDSLACSKINTTVSTLKITSESIDTLFGLVLPVRIAERKQSYNYSVRRMFGWGLGLLQYHNLNDGWGLGYTLIYAKIDGIEYGAPSNLDSLLQFHPMHIGNEWTYVYYSENKLKSLVKKVVRDTIIHENIYSVIETSFPGSNTISYQFERMDSTDGVFMEGIGDRCIVLDSISAPYGKIFGETGEWREVDQISPEVIMGISLMTRTILYRVTPTNPRITYAWGIGQVVHSSQEEHPSLPMLVGNLLKIVHATINGKEYGTKNILMADSLSLYHPLQTGNRWIYRTTSYNPPSLPTVSYYSREVTGDTIIGTTLYKRIAEKNSAGNITGRSSELFDEITGNYIVHNISGPVIEDSSAANVDNSHFGANGMRKLVSVFIDSLFGTARVQREIRVANQIAENEMGWVYAYGLGRIKHYIKELDPSPHGIIVEELVYAKINNVEYGTEPLGIDNESQGAPIEFSLYQNYPNPFNPATVIEFAVPAASSRDIVTLRIFDMLGREIRTLVNEPVPPGRHTVRFDAAGLATGLYFYHIQSGTFVDTKKMMYIK